jgi:hypothetical protein
MRTLVDVWTVAWTLALGLGYLADRTPVPRLALLREPRAAHALLLSSAAMVLGLILGGRPEAGAILTAWAVVTASVKMMLDNWEEMGE